MNDTVYLMDLFSACPLSEDRRAVFQQAKVLGADIDPEARRVEVRLFAPTYLSELELQVEPLRDQAASSKPCGTTFRPPTVWKGSPSAVPSRRRRCPRLTTGTL